MGRARWKRGSVATSEAARLARLRAEIINSKDLPTIPVLLARMYPALADAAPALRPCPALRPRAPRRGAALRALPPLLIRSAPITIVRLLSP